MNVMAGAESGRLVRMSDPVVHYDCNKCVHFISVKFVDGALASIRTHTCTKLSAHEDCDYEERRTCDG